MRYRWAVVGCVTLAGASQQLVAQDSSAVRRAVNGIAFDSLRGLPLAGAFVTLTAPGHPAAMATSDAQGRFHFDGVVPGVYLAAMQHAVFDSIGLSGISARVSVTDGRDTIRLVAPSFERLWHAACGDRAPPRDSGFVFGIVRAATTRRPVADAIVSVRWVDLVPDKSAGFAQRSWLADVRADATGEYRACDVPGASILRVDASTDSTLDREASGVVDIIPNGRRVERLDLYIGPRAGDSTGLARGTVAGVVTNEQGAPVPDVRVHTDGAAETRSDSAGRFILRQLAVGTREVDVLSIGSASGSQIVDVLPGDTARVAIQLRKVTVLKPVDVQATAYRQYVVRGFEERRSKGPGYFNDSTEISKHGSLPSVFDGIPGVIVDHGSRSRRGVRLVMMQGARNCTPSLWIDGLRSTMDQLNDVAPEDIAATEVYSHALDVPLDFAARTNGALCGAVVVWTKRAFP